MRRHAGGNTIVHTSHKPIHSSLMRLGARFFDEEAMSLAKNMLSQHSPPSIVDLVIRSITDLAMSRSTMENIRKSGIAEQHGFAPDGNDSVATRALKVLEDEGIQFCYITGRFHNASDAVTVKSLSSRGLKGHKEEQEKIAVVTSVGTDNEQSDYIKETINGLTLGKLR